MFLSLVAALPNEEARLKYIHTVAAAAITSEALRVNVHTKDRNSQKCAVLFAERFIVFSVTRF